MPQSSDAITAGLTPADMPYIEATRRWVERAVVGLNLCPFARAPFVQGTIRYAVSQARDSDTLLDDNDFLDVADAAVEALRLDGVLQVARFHPPYQFADSAPDDSENFSNRSPYPTLHLLREASVERAMEAMSDTDEIYRRNIDTLRRLGFAGWQ